MILIFVLFVIAIVTHARVWGFFDLANPIVFMLDYHLFFLSLGVFVFYFNLYPAYEIQQISLFLVLASYVVTTLSAFVTYFVIGKYIRLRLSSISYERFISHSDVKSNILSDLFWVIGVLLTIAVVFKSGFSALLSMSAGEGFEDERVAAMSGNGILVIPAQIFLLVGTVWAVSRADRSFIIKVFMFLVAVICMVSFGFRSGVAFLVAICGLNYLYNKFGKVPSFKITIFAFFALSFFVFMGVLRKGEGDVLERFMASFFWRSFVTLYNLDVILSNYKDFLHGEGILMELAVIVPGPDINLGAHLKEVLGYDFPGGGITPSYIGAGYIDFGIWGAVLYPAFTGVLVASSYVLWPVFVGRSGLSFLLLLIFSVTTSGVSAAGFVSPYLYFGIPLFLLGLGVRLVLSMRLLMHKNNA